MNHFLISCEVKILAIISLKFIKYVVPWLHKTSIVIACQFSKADKLKVNNKQAFQLNFLKH